MQQALLVGLMLSASTEGDTRRSLDELARLAETAGIVPVHSVIQRRSRLDPAYCIGRGKAEELRGLCANGRIPVVIFDCDLRPVQQKNLEELLETVVIDRTRLILDIFACRARSREGILQVERAQLAYYLPRLSKKGIMLDSQAGGIGTRRGPGERKLELDQRRIRERITALDRELEQVRRTRQLQRQKRAESGQPSIAIAGYTNAGKSTLLNAVSASSVVYADDKLFATLDPTTRLVRLPGGRKIVCTDTVGFIDKLPHALVAAFRATLEEISGAHCILHVIDSAHPDHARQMRTVYTVLQELGAGHVPVLEVFNKADLLSAEERSVRKKNGQVLIAAKTGQGIDGLLRRIETIVMPRLASHRLTIPFTRSAVIAGIRDLAVVKKQGYSGKGILLSLSCRPEQWPHIQALAGLQPSRREKHDTGK